MAELTDEQIMALMSPQMHADLAAAAIAVAGDVVCARGAARVVLNRHAVDLVRAAIAAARPQQGWQPIDTAPQDGTEILASDYDTIEILSWNSDAWGNRDGSIMFPAWWQPLPDHPPILQPPQGGEVES